MLVGEPADQRLRLPAPQIVEADAGVRPARTPEVLAVERPWRTRMTVIPQP